MGSQLSTEPVERPRPYSITSDEITVQVVSQSRFYCLVQQSIIWNDYFALRDQRSKDAFASCHLVNAKEASQPTEDLAWAWEMYVLVYGADEQDPAVLEFVQRLTQSDTKPKSIFILEGRFKKFIKRYKLLAHTSDCATSFPGPIELIPPTKTIRGTYAIHRVHFLRSRPILARLNCRTVINISSRRLFVKSPGIILENVSFKDEPDPNDHAITIYRNFAKKKRKKSLGNILIIDEAGCDYASLMAAWHLHKEFNINMEDAIESVSSRIGFLDAWYSDVLGMWVS